jgi:hypothetical protein
LKFIQISGNIKENKNQEPSRVAGRLWPMASACWPSPAMEVARAPMQRDAWSPRGGRARFKISNSLKMFKFFQTLIDPNLIFLSSKNLK